MRTDFPLWIKSSFVSIYNFTIKNSPITDFSAGLYVRLIPYEYLTDFQISNCIIKNNDCGIKLQKTKNVIISNCTINNNDGHSIYVLGSININIQFCDIFENGVDVPPNACFSGGIVITSNCNQEDSDMIKVSCCDIHNNIGDGILNIHSKNNSIYHNNFYDNDQNAYDRCDGNKWFNDKIFEGNYWDNYIGIDLDGDGIGEIPYKIPPKKTNNKDRFPLMKPWQNICNKKQNSHLISYTQNKLLYSFIKTNLFPILVRLLNII